MATFFFTWIRCGSLYVGFFNCMCSILTEIALDNWCLSNLQGDRKWKEEKAKKVWLHIFISSWLKRVTFIVYILCLLMESLIDKRNDCLKNLNSVSDMCNDFFSYHIHELLIFKLKTFMAFQCSRIAIYTHTHEIMKRNANKVCLLAFCS